MESKNYSIKVTPELAAALNARIVALDADPETLSFRDMIDLLLDAPATVLPPAPPPVVETDEYIELLGTCESLKSEIKLLQSQCAENVDIAARLENAESQLQQSNERVLETEKLLTANRMPAGAVVLQPEPEMLQLLTETCRNLVAASSQYNECACFSDVTPGKLLIYMFERYLTERCADWFFPLAAMPAKRVREFLKR